MRPKIQQYAEALTALNSDDVILSCDENGVISIDWKETTPIDMDTIDAKVAELNAVYDTKQYQRDRRPEYPNHEDCIHALLDGGDTLTDLQAKRTAVKNKYPKP